jgi:hypothetical protein
MTEITQAPQATAPQGKIPNYLVWSILVTVLCCLPLGIVAIIFSSQVDTKQNAGDIAGALDSSNKAKLFCWISFGLGVLGTVAYIGFMVIAGGLAAAGAAGGM